MTRRTPPLSELPLGGGIVALFISEKGILQPMVVDLESLHDGYESRYSTWIRVEGEDFIMLHKRVLSGDERVSASYLYYDLEAMERRACDIMKGAIMIVSGIPGGVWRSISKDEMRLLKEHIGEDVDGGAVLWIDEPDKGPIEEGLKDVAYWLLNGPNIDIMTVKRYRPWKIDERAEMELWRMKELEIEENRKRREAEIEALKHKRGRKPNPKPPRKRKNRKIGRGIDEMDGGEQQWDQI